MYDFEIIPKDKTSENRLKEIKDKIEKFSKSNISIAKVTIGWKPLLAKTDYYSNYEELEKFYNKNKDNLKILDNFGCEYSFEELKENLNIRQKYKSNIEKTIDCYLDKNEFEFSPTLKERAIFNTSIN